MKTTIPSLLCLHCKNAHNFRERKMGFDGKYGHYSLVFDCKECPNFMLADAMEGKE